MRGKGTIGHVKYQNLLSVKRKVQARIYRSIKKNELHIDPEKLEGGDFLGP